MPICLFMYYLILAIKFEFFLQKKEVGLLSSLLAFAINILRIMKEFVLISKFQHILNKISNADDLGLIFYGSIGLCSRMACSMVAWCVCFGAAFFWNVPSVRPMRLESPFRRVRLVPLFDPPFSRVTRDANGRTTRGNCTEATSRPRFKPL